MEHKEYFEHIEKAREVVKVIQPYITNDECTELVKTLAKGSVSILTNKE
ncbi:hypothetical protein NVV56_09400 [Aeromonas dhakensis]|nr:hypothetical protein [Aeromonas dhakensis]MCR6739105.1 hypothetical protein [Aeromonas dhakensis]